MTAWRVTHRDDIDADASRREGEPPMAEGLEALDRVGAALDRILLALDECPPVDDPLAKAAAVTIRAAALEAIEALLERRAEVDAAAAVIVRAVLPALGVAPMSAPADRHVDA